MTDNKSGVVIYVGMKLPADSGVTKFVGIFTSQGAATRWIDNVNKKEGGPFLKDKTYAIYDLTSPVDMAEYLCRKKEG